jgi:hypothetical protein
VECRGLRNKTSRFHDGLLRGLLPVNKLNLIEAQVVPKEDAEKPHSPDLIFPDAKKPPWGGFLDGMGVVARRA